MSVVTVTPANVRPLEGAVVRRFNAGGALVVGDAVYVASDGDIEQADGDVSAAKARAIGVVVASYDGETTIAADHAASVVVHGPVGGFSSLTPGAYGYVSNTAGGIDTAAGTFAFILGYNESASIFFVSPGIDDPTS